MTVHYEVVGPVAVVTIDRPDVRNAVDRPTAAALADAFTRFDADDGLAAAVLTGADGVFCAGADLKAMSDPNRERVNHLSADGDGPLGPTRMQLAKPVVAAVEGHAVAGGLELALWCDLRVASETAVFGVFCRRWGVPLVDGGTVRLPRIIGQGPALDLILTGRAVGADEALRLGLANRVVPAGTARDAAVALATDLAALPQVCLRNDRASVYAQWDLPLDEALQQEGRLGLETLRAPGAMDGAARFAAGAGRHGVADSSPRLPTRLPTRPDAPPA
jgi:enoyl-CoA hydratase